jgi:hypothetical protein
MSQDGYGIIIATVILVPLILLGNALFWYLLVLLGEGNMKKLGSTILTILLLLGKEIFWWPLVRIMKTPESYEKEEICKYLDSIGAWYCKPATYGRGKSGVPDIVVCIKGKFVAIEVKRPGMVATKIQARRMEEIRGAHGIAIAGPAELVITLLKSYCL